MKPSAAAVNSSGWPPPPGFATHGDWLTAEWIATALTAARGRGLDVHLQPIVTADNGRLVACEALSRMTPCAPSQLPPKQFLAVAAQAGMLDDVTWMVIEHAAADARTLAEHGFPIPVTLNISAVSFDNPELIQRLMNTLERYELPPSALILEITERAPFVDPEAACDIVARLTTHGFCVALDDYGIGYSDAARLTSLSVGIVKIDRSTVREHRQPARRRELDDLLRVAADRELITIAEGVESAADAVAMTALGVDWLQGFWTAPAMPVADFLTWAHGQPDTRPDLADHDLVTPRFLTAT
ncbi:hypothetical protein BH24ACT15_BH24ACT15_12670 [soil metagenome]